MCNMKVSHSTNMYYTHTNALHHPSQLCKCHPVWTAEIHSRKIPNHSEHVCQICLIQEQVLKFIIGIKGITLSSNRTGHQIQNIDINHQMHHWHCTKILTIPHQHKEEQKGQYVFKQQWNHITKTQCQVQNLCNRILQVFCTNIMEPATKDHQKITKPG